jgi:hypothetical protein
MSAQSNVFASQRSQRQSVLAAQRAQRLSAATTKGLITSKTSKALTEARPASVKLWESGMVLGVNAVLIGTAIITLTHLVPYQLRQHDKLKEIRAEESSLSQNIQALEQSYEQNKSPEAAQRVAQQQGNLMPLNHMNVILTEPASKPQ